MLQLYEAVENFASPPHYTSNIFERRQRHAFFPNVTICPFNRFIYSASHGRLSIKAVPGRALPR